jgi:hypothetical protein
MRNFGEILTWIRRSDFAELAFVVLREQEGAPETRPALPARALRLARDRTRRTRFAFGVVETVGRRRLPPGTDPFEPLDVRDLLADVPSLAVRPVVEGFSQYFPDDALEALRAARLDVLLRFGFGILKGGVLGVARYGVWSYHHGDNRHYRGSAPGIWELIEDAPASGAMLQVLNERLDAGFVLARGEYPTARGLSSARNRLRPYWGTSFFVLHKLRQLHDEGWDAVRASAVPDEPYVGRRKSYRVPTNGEVVRWVGRAAAGWVRDRASGARPIDQEWELAVRRRTTDAPPGAADTYTRIPSPAGRFLADPCLAGRGGETFVFFEDWDWTARQGAIGCGRLTDDGRLAEVREVLRRPYHLSFPFVFERDGAWYMIPETKADGRVRLLRATAFPDRWEEEAVLFEGDATDTVMYEQDGTFYFFTTLWEPRGEATAHCLFVADGLTAPWRLHPASPLSTGLRGIRAGGPLVWRDGTLLRPVQDARRGYGVGLDWMRVDELTPTTFRESLVDSLVPPPDRDGGHTYSATADWEIIDLCWNRRRRDPAGTQPARERAAVPGPPASPMPNPHGGRN